MLNSDILDIAMGLIFVYLVLSLFCSAMNELIESRLKGRSTNLERGIRELLGDQRGTGLARAIYTHPLIAGLFKGTYDPALIKNGVYTNKELPSYVPSRNFALALMDAVLPATATQASGASGAVAAAAPAAAGAHPQAAAAGMQPPPIKALRDAVASLPNAEAQKALLTLIDSAGNDIVRARENIEGWFDSAMDRVAGWYKRRTQSILVVLGVIVAVVMNADTISIARRLSVDKSLRNSLVATATAYANEDPAKSGGPPPECVPNESSDACQKLAPPCRKAMTSECRVDRDLAQLRTLGLPLGWTMGTDDPRSVWVSLRTPAGLWTWLGHLCGWLLTAFAISLGAPFWFDLLNKFSVVRSTVKPQEKSKD